MTETERERLEEEMRQCARESGWPDDFYFALIEAVFGQAGEHDPA